MRMCKPGGFQNRSRKLNSQKYDSRDTAFTHIDNHNCFWQTIWIIQRIIINGLPSSVGGPWALGNFRWLPADYGELPAMSREKTGCRHTLLIEIRRSFFDWASDNVRLPWTATGTIYFNTLVTTHDDLKNCLLHLQEMVKTWSFKSYETLCIPEMCSVSADVSLMVAHW